MLSAQEVAGVRVSKEESAGEVSREAPACNYCGSREHTSLFDGFDPDIVRCNSCGLIFNAAMPTDQELASIYGEDYYTSKDSLRYGYTDYLADRDNIIKTSRRRLAGVERIKAGGSLLDVGCAFGFFLEVARERGWSVSGVEISTFAADFAAGELGLDVVNQNAEAWEYGVGRYDVITMWDLIEHLRDPAGTVGRLARALKDGGVLVLSTPDVDSLPARLLGGRWLGWQLRNEHLHYFSYSTLERMLNAAGLEVIRSGHIGKHVTFDLFIDRLALYGRAPAALLAHLRKLFPRPWSFYVNPLDIICVYARLRTPRDVS